MKEEIVLKKIYNYMLRIERILITIDPLSEEDILEKDESFALTQMLTNVFSLATNIDSEEVQKDLLPLYGRGLSVCRNIASHDYDSLDWVRVKQVAHRMLSLKGLVLSHIDILERNKSNGSNKMDKF